MAYNATVIRIIAGCYYEWTKEGDDWKSLADFLVDASLRPGESEGTLLVDAGLVASGGISPTAQQGIVVSAIDYITQQGRESNA